MPAGQQIALEPALALMLAEHFHDPAIGCEMVIPRVGFCHPGTIGDLEDVLPAIGVVFVRAEKSEILCLHVQLHHIAEEPAHDAGGLGGDRAGAGTLTA